MFWAVTTEKIVGVAAAASIAVINTVAQFAGLGLPPVLGAIKDSTGNYNGGLLLIAAALIVGGVLGRLVTRNHRSHNGPRSRLPARLFQIRASIQRPMRCLRDEPRR